MELHITNRLLSSVLRMEDKIDEMSRAKAAADFYGETNPTFAIRPGFGLILGMIEMYSLELIGPSP